VGQHRSSQRHCRAHRPDEPVLRARLHQLARRHPRYGYRRIHVLLVRAGWVRVPAGPGVGNPPDETVLSQLNAQRRWFPATYT